MTAKRAMMSAALVILLGVLWIAGSATAHTAPDTPPGSGDVHIAGVTAPLLQYQGRLTDPGTGEPAADGSHTMTFRLYESASGGNELWTETKDVAVQDGVFSTILGDKTSLDQKVFDGRELWLGVKVGADTEATPRQRVLPVAYALSLVPGAQISNTISSVSFTQGGDAIVGHGGGSDWDAGVVGYGSSESHGMGVAGWGQVTSGESYGVFGSSRSPYGAGVYGEGYSGSHGVYGETFHEGGFYETAGVLGYSVYTDSAGVMGNSKFGNGVFGYISTVTSTSSAVAAVHSGAGNALSAYSAQGHGVSGETDNATGGYEFAGVYGQSTHTETFGVLGESTYGVGVEGRIFERQNSEAAVSGWNSGGGSGVRGYSTHARGVEGISDYDTGVRGQTTVTGTWEFAGVHGHSVYSQTFGVLGESDYGIGVEGRITEPANTNPAVVGYNSGSGIGMFGFSEDGVAVAGHGETYGAEFSSDSGTALRADGDAEVDGNLTVSGNLSGGSHTHSTADITSGTLSSSRFSAYSDLSSEAYLNNDASGDLLTRSQADGRYVNEQQTNSITSEMITNGAVQSNDLADGAAMAEILDDDGAGSGLDADLLDGYHAAGMMSAAGSASIYGLTTSTSVTQMDSFTVYAPGPGMLTVFVIGSTWLDCDATSSSSRLCTGAALGICDTAGSSTSCGNTYDSFYHEDPDNAYTTNEEHPVTLARTVSVGAAGARTFYLNGRSHENGMNWRIDGYVLAIFAPASMTVTTS
jgi:hypothetical protein